MAEDAVEVVRRFHEAYGREDWATTDSILAENQTFTPTPDHPQYEIYEGKEQVRTYFRAWLGAWERLEYDIRNVEELSPGAVLAEIWTRLRGKASGVELEATDFLVHRVREGRIGETVVYASEKEARASVA